MSLTVPLLTTTTTDVSSMEQQLSIVAARAAASARCQPQGVSHLQCHWCRCFALVHLQMQEQHEQEQELELDCHWSPPYHACPLWWMVPAGPRFPAPLRCRCRRSYL